VERLQKLLELQKSDPHDPFILYAIALEYQKFDLAKALQLLDELMHKHPDYLPTYYQAAVLYADSGNYEKAKATCEQGIEVAKSQNNQHARQELQNAYNNFLFEEG
jgi:tetratricopeptide (TPR) repeat protein